VTDATISRPSSVSSSTRWGTGRPGADIPYTTYRDLSEKPEVIELIQKVVDETNKKFARVENIRKFKLIPKELDHEDGELTATQKLKRSSMEECSAS
jgi:long-chain acyl-CoA synthetase